MPKLTKCPNCQTWNENQDYCSNCGGHLKKQRISMSHLLSSIVDFFSNFEDKYVHTFVSLTTRPINFISHYLHGVPNKNKKTHVHQQPTKMQLKTEVAHP